MSNPALWTAIAGVVAAVGGLVGLFVHSRGPKHGPAIGGVTGPKHGPPGTQ